MRVERLERRECLSGVVQSPYLHQANLYTNSSLQTPGLVGSYINQSLRNVADSSDWRISQSVSGSRVDPVLNWDADGWGQRAPLGLTHGNDTNWERFSVQWDGVIQVTQSGQRLATVSDDGSRMWIDLDQDGQFAATELVDNGWGGLQGTQTGERTVGIPAGVYPIRIQYYEEQGGNRFTLASSPFVPRQFQPTDSNPVQVVKVLVINFDPLVPSEGNRKMHQVFGWSDPAKLAARFEQDIEWATGGAIDIQIVDWRERDAFPIFTNGFRYNPDEYVELRRKGSGWDERTTDLRELVAAENLAPLVNSGGIDELWLFGDHFFNLLGEAWMMGPNSFFINGPTFSDLGFDRAIAGYGFNYERSVGEMLHNLAHRIENHGQRAFGSWNLANPSSPWDRFSANYLDTSSGPYGVGTCHVPANADTHYEYDDARTVTSRAADFPNYPNLTNRSEIVGRSTWAFGPQPDHHRDYLNWYLAMMPANDGVDAQGREANWYNYIWDFNSYEPGTGLARQEDAFAAADPVALAGATSHVVMARYYDVNGTNLASLGEDDLIVVGPDNVSHAARFVGETRSSKTSAGEATTAKYLITPPGGAWDATDNGSYRIRLKGGSVTDKGGVPFAESEIGSFQVEIATGAELNVRGMLADGRATVTHTALDIGPIANLFDGQTGTLVRTPNINPAVVTLSFQQPQAVEAFRIYVSHAGGNPSHRYTIEAADSLAELESRTGSYRELVGLRGIPSDRFDTLTVPGSVTGRAFRLTVSRLTGDGYVHLNEWQLIGKAISDQEPPIVTLGTIPQPVDQGQAQFLSVVYEDVSGVRVPSLGTGDILITGPGGARIEPTFYDVDGVTDGNRRVATYWFIPPGGSWGAGDEGRYTLTSVGGEVVDALRNASAVDRVLGSFVFPEDFNEPPAISPSTFRVSESTPSGSVIGAVVATDDPRQSIRYSLVQGNGDFAIDALTGTIRLRQDRALDFERASSHLLRVRAIDNAPLPAAAEADVTILVTNENEPPVAIASSRSVSFIAAAPMRFTIPDGWFIEPDVGQVLEYSILPIGEPPTWVTIDPARPALSGHPWNPQVGEFQFKLIATDSIDPSLSAEMTLRVIVAPNATPWQNPIDRLDVDGNQELRPLDALLVLNHIGRRSDLTVAFDVMHRPNYLDVDGNNRIEPIDALLVLNGLGRLAGAAGESEFLFDVAGAWPIPELFWFDRQESSTRKARSLPPNTRTFLAVSSK